MATSWATETQLDNAGRTRCERVLLVFFLVFLGKSRCFWSCWCSPYPESGEHFMDSSWRVLHVCMCCISRASSHTASQGWGNYGGPGFGNHICRTSASRNLKTSRESKMWILILPHPSFHTPYPTCPHHRKMILALFCHRWALAKPRLD